MHFISINFLEIPAVLKKKIVSDLVRNTRLVHSMFPSRD